MLNLFRNLLLASGCLLFTGFTPLNSPASIGVVSKSATNLPAKNINALYSKYDEWGLTNKHISRQLFNYAVKGYEYLIGKNLLHNTDIISIADMSQPSSEKRLYVININSGEILFNTLVAHGRNSGQEVATKFSNSQSSFETSLGFYTTSDTYYGKHGYSLRLKGCERGFNDNAFKRAIVVHGADYVSESFIQQNGFLGRSHGCPAVPDELSEEIINTIKNGSCLFVYSPSKKYLKQSAILNN